MISKNNLSFRLILIVLCAVFFTTSASAHFKLNLNVRVIHVEHLNDGLNIYMRLPMPYLVAHLLGKPDENGLPIPAPYTTNRLEDGKLVHFVDADAFNNSLDKMNMLVKEGLILSIDGHMTDLDVKDIHIYKNGSHPDFSTLQEAKNSFSKKNSFVAFDKEVYVGDTIVDVVLRYNSDETVYKYALSSRLNPGLPDQESTANLILDYSPGGVQVFRERGLLQEPVIVTNSLLDAMITFVEEGVKHILEGIDHVLFVICLVLGSLSITSLLWRVTGFTLGHSVTLSLGFFGFVPSAAWFVPAVETGIALSIVYIAFIALLPDSNDALKRQNSEIKVVIITSLIGMLHGLGFSFVLQNILNVSSPSIWQSLLAFNVGVEIGQLFIVILTFITLYLVTKIGTKTEKFTRYLLAAGSIVIGLIWVVERGSTIISSEAIQILS